MSIKESALSAITSITQSDFIRAVTSAGASRRVTVANLAKAIIESYTGSSLAGQNQSVEAALNALNSNIAVSTHVSVTVSDGFYRIPYPDGFDRNASIFIQPLYVSGGIIGWESTLQLTPTDVIVYIRQNGSSPASDAIVSFKALFVKP